MELITMLAVVLSNLKLLPADWYDLRNPLRSRPNETNNVVPVRRTRRPSGLRG
jgi:hypothetical protein